MFNKHNFLLLKYRKLDILEIEFSNNLKNISKEIIFKLLNSINYDIKMISIVINIKNLDIELLNFTINTLKQMKKSISLTVKGKIKNDKLYNLKNNISQFRFILNDEVENYIDYLYNNFKTKSNDIVFIYEVSKIDIFINRIKPLIKKRNYIFNISIKNSISISDYWKLANELSSLKSKFPLNVLYDVSCAAIKYKNLQGICPGFLCLLCIDVDGYGKFCYKEKANYKYNINKYNLDYIFNNIYKEYLPQNYCKKFKICFGGCPIHRTKSCNKYCGMKGDKI